MGSKIMLSFTRIWKDTCANLNPSLKKDTVKDCKPQVGVCTAEQSDKNALLPPQPNTDWDWYLTIGVDEVCMSSPDWETIEENLCRLKQTTDSYLILEQKDPRNSENIWFIQCAVAKMGPNQGEYVVEIGFNTCDRHFLWERFVPDVLNAMEYFSAAYHHRNVDTSGFYSI